MVHWIATSNANASSNDGATEKSSAASLSTLSFPENQTDFNSLDGNTENSIGQANPEIEKLQAELEELGKKLDEKTHPHQGRVRVLSYLDQTKGEHSDKLEVVELFVKHSHLTLEIFRKNGGTPRDYIVKALEEFSDSLCNWGTGDDSVTDSDICTNLADLKGEGDEWWKSLTQKQVDQMPHKG